VDNASFAIEKLLGGFLWSLLAVYSRSYERFINKRSFRGKGQGKAVSGSVSYQR